MCVVGLTVTAFHPKMGKMSQLLNFGETYDNKRGGNGRKIFYIKRGGNGRKIVWLSIFQFRIVAVFNHEEKHHFC